MNRRDFLTGAALGLGVAGLTLAGCATQQTSSRTPATGAGTRNDTDRGASSATAPAFDIGARTVRLNDDALMPILGIGTFRLSPDQAEASVSSALQAGYRLIDTARIYGNEAGVGRGVARSGVPREDIFITTKLWTDDFDEAARAIDTGLERLDVDYIDLLLLHHTAPSDEDAYRAMEDAVADGRVRSIGLSNFYEQDFARMMGVASITPTVVQNETHPYHQGTGFSQYLSQFGTRLESWFPLGGRGNNQVLFEDATIADIARSHGRTPAQILLRWHLQAGNIAIPGSSDPDHIRENIAIFDFTLSDDEMRGMGDLERDQRFSTY